MKLSAPFARWFDVGDTSTPATSALVLERLKFLTRLMPVLFAVLLIDALTIAYVLPSTVDPGLRIGSPVAFVLVSALRLHYWLTLRPGRLNPDEALRVLSRSQMVTAGLCAIFSIWVIVVLQHVEGEARAVIGLLAFLGAVGSACCFGSLPSAARLVLLFAALPVTLWLLASGDALLVCIGVNLAAFLLLLGRILDASQRGFAKLIGSRAEIAAERERATRAELNARQIAGRFEMTLNNMSQGVCFYDGSKRLVLWNNRYIDMYQLPPDKVRAGMALREIVELRVAAGSSPVMPEAEYMAWRDRIAVSDEPSDTVVELKNGRIIEISHRPMPDHGWVATHEDVTERKRAEYELRETREFLDAVIENVPVTIFVKNVGDQRYALANRAAERLLGVARNELIGRTADEFFGAETAKTIAQLDRAAIESGEPLVHTEISMNSRGQGTRTVNSTRVLIRSRDGSPRAVMRVIEDITERKRAEHWIMHLASHDSLTGLPNRSAFEERFTAMLDEARSTQARFAVMCVDLDRFKEINDLFGHAVGDVVLREVSERLRGTADGAFVARIGGDEFAVLSTVGEGFDVRALAERLHAAFVDDVIAEDHVFQLGLSIGIALFPDDGSDARTLIGNADAALYRAKNEGRGVIRFFTATMDQQLRERRALEHDLRAAIANGELALEYQPQASIDRRIIGFEALARWTHPRRGPVSPAEFIPIAEESDLIVDIGEWVLREACREAASWGEPLQVAVNVSAVQFRRGDLRNLVHAILLETGLPPHRLELEITEGVLVENVSRAASMLRGLKALGVGIALDDFGTGYSSLSYLQSFPLDRIKIDRIFTSTLGKTEGSLAIVRAVIGLAHGLRLPVLAEGVETAAQLAILREESCDDIQGYLIGPPRPIAHYAEAVGRQPMSCVGRVA